MGSSGMLGHQMLELFKTEGLDVYGTNRRKVKSDNRIFEFDIFQNEINHLLDQVPKIKTVINNIGVIKTHINDKDSVSVQNAIEINAKFPHLLAKAAGERGIKVIQIATDCVYSGQQANYDENAIHNAWDVYGKTKSLGEANSTNVLNLRCSIIGRELNRNTSLIEWVLGQPQNAQVNGFTNHYWNGLTTLGFSKICLGIVKDEVDYFGTHHIIPTQIVSKYELVSSIAEVFGRKDISVLPVETDVSVNRSLSTIDEDFNAMLWIKAGYNEIPSVTKLLKDYAQSFIS